MIHKNRITNWSGSIESDPREAAIRLEETIRDRGIDQVDLEAWLAGYATAVMDNTRRAITRTGERHEQSQ